MGRPFSEGWRLLFTVLMIFKLGTLAVFIVFHNLLHSEWWYGWPVRESPPWMTPIVSVISVLLLGKGRWLALKYHDMHHAFPWTMGDPCCRARFYGAQMVEEACDAIASDGIFLE